MSKSLYIFDVDGTLRMCNVPGQPCPNSPGEWEVIEQALPWFRRTHWQSTRIAFVSNQGGAGLGLLEETVARRMLRDLWNVLLPEHVQGYIYMCPHRPKAGCDCRKPKPALVLSAIADLGGNRSTTILVGDLDSDRLCAEAAGVDFSWAWDFFGTSQQRWPR